MYIKSIRKKYSHYYYNLEVKLGCDHVIIFHELVEGVFKMKTFQFGLKISQ